ncbi:alpha/beta hydrolase [Caulifigura coniformis]|nr:alpha/beta hydrolase [Caulifigura coniformis]
MHRSLFPVWLIARFVWLLLAWSILFAPRAMGGGVLIVDGDPRTVTQAVDVRIVQETASTVDEPSFAAPAVPQLEQPRVYAGPCYWSVSSRQSAQHPRDWNGCPLEVTQRNPDGSWTRSSIPHLVGQLQPGTPVLICVHGSFVSVEDNCKESAEAYNALRASAPGLPVHVIFYTWPSDGPYTFIAPVDVAVRGCRSDFNGFHIAWLLSNIPDQHPICLWGHSHGNRAVMSCVQLLAGGEVEDYCFTGYRSQGKRVRIVMAAAAFDHNWLNPGQRYDRVPGRVEGILNLQNRKDLPLAFYPLSRPFAHRAIARSGVTPRDRSKLGPQAAKIADCDVTDLLGHAHYWPEYYSRPSIMQTAIPYVYYVGRSG